MGGYLVAVPREPAQRGLALGPGGPDADGRGEVVSGRVEADVAVAPEREQLAPALAARAQRQLPRRLLPKQLALRGRQRAAAVQQQATRVLPA